MMYAQCEIEELNPSCSQGHGRTWFSTALAACEYDLKW